MYAQTSNIPTRSVIQNYFAGGGWPFQLRHPGAWTVVRALAVVWFLTLGSILCSHGYAWGALVYLAAAKDLTLGYRLLRTSRAPRR
ncbi:MAG TPA: hypothetical protein VMA73_04685 [Streptosporangiaceae bacterium]|nr:hypothetical protein [Streptosporangiaceae bacterium]